MELLASVLWPWIPVLLAALGILTSTAAAPLQADFWNCNPKPVWNQSATGDLKPNCCTLEAMMRNPEPLYKTWQQYLEQSGLLDRPMRVRPAAHLIADNETYLQQLDLAFRLHKALPDDDPRSQISQMNFHCLYGSPGVAHQAGYQYLNYLVHNNWYFFPFHRWFTFFYERMLAKLVGDDSFVLPFWNWDNQSTNSKHLPDTVPHYFRNPDKYPGLYHKYRDPRHRPGEEPAIINLLVESVKTGFSPKTAQEVALTRALNKAHLRSVIVDRTANGSRGDFLSYPMRLGELIPDFKVWRLGFEAQAHLAVHFWIGDPAYLYADMGLIYHAVRDPLFFPHHANVDRIWNVWMGLEGRSNYDDADFLDAAFYFYDENAELVRVTVAECLNSDLLKYTYQDVENEWVTYDASPDAALFLADPSPAHSQE